MMTTTFVTPTPVLSQQRHSRLVASQRRSAQPSRMQPRATIAVPRPTTPEPESAPWMPVADVVHEIRTPEQFDVLRGRAEEDGKLLVVDFMAAWCRKCMYLLPRLRKMAKEGRGVYFCSVDVNKVKRLPKEFAIEKMPTFVFWRGGERDRLVGAMKPEVVVQGLRERLERLAKEES